MKPYVINVLSVRQIGAQVGVGSWTGVIAAPCVQAAQESAVEQHNSVYPPSGGYRVVGIFASELSVEMARLAILAEEVE